MAKAKEFVQAHGEAALSASGQYLRWLPPVHWLEGKVTGLNQPGDMRLRWRTGFTGPGEENWQTIPGTKSAKKRDLSTWGSALLTVGRADMEDALGRGWGASMGVAYRLGSYVMVGVNERSEEPILTPVDAEGTPDADGELLAAGVRTGFDPNTITSGIVLEGGMHMYRLPTGIIAVEAIPEGVHRI